MKGKHIRSGTKLDVDEQDVFELTKKSMIEGKVSRGTMTFKPAKKNIRTRKTANVDKRFGIGMK